MTTHLTIEEVLSGAARHNARRAADGHVLAEESCHDQAKRELQGECKSGMEYIRKTLRRAQEIKLERMAQLGKV